MDSYLYLLELFIEEISLSSNISDKTKLEEIIVTGEIKKFLRIDIASMQKEEPTGGRKIQINSGKSSLFAHNFENFYKKMSDNPFIISLSINGQVIGQSFVNWSKNFLQLVKKGPETYGVMGPTSMKDVFTLTDTDEIVGDIKATIKLSSFGYNLETSYQVITDNNKNKILIKGVNDKTIFQCQQLNQIGTSSEILPMPLLTAFSDTGESESKCSIEPMSLFALYKSNLETKFSFANAFNPVSTSYIPNQAQKTFSTQTFDIVSIIERPKERKLTDIHQYQNFSKGFPFKVESSDYKAERSISEQYSTSSNYLTNDKINALLCKNKDCPAAKKFKEFGLGPLARTQNLGSPLRDAKPPISYGLSQTYGVLDEYGPYGLFLHPKKLKDSFISKKGNNLINSSCQPTLRQNQIKKNYHIHLPLRLTGGGISNYDDVKSPFLECKEVMQQLDELVHKYKQALGPCGKTICPFAPNVTKEFCKKMCHKDNSTFFLPSEYNPPLKNELQEKLNTLKQYKGKPACGSPKCAYAKYKEGLSDEDAMIELQYLPPDISEKCGHSKCPFPVQCDLPPIHWDCPEPLPKDICKNSNCPYLPKDIKCLNSVLYKSLCNNKTCPYSPPQPCLAPMCPFADKKCPYEEKNNFEKICDNPDCPYVESNNTCKNINSCDIENSTAGGDSTRNNFSEIINMILKHLLSAYNISIPNLCFGGSQCPYNKHKNKHTECVSKKSSPCFLSQNNSCNNTGDSVTANSENLDSNNFICNNQDCLYNEKSLKDTCHTELKSSKPENKQSTDDACFFNEKNKSNSVDYVSKFMTNLDHAPCTKGTYKIDSKEIPCDSCPCAVEKKISKNKLDIARDDSNTVSTAQIKKTKRKKKRKFVYSIGGKYPGVKIGHRTCVMPGPNVPATMGWLWNICSPYHQLKSRRGWRPGAIAKTIAARIRAHRKAQGINMLELKNMQEKKYEGQYKSNSSINVNPKATLQIKKREGCYWITMNPLKDPYFLVENEDPYVDCTPLQFKIEKNKNCKKLNTAEYKSCFCEDDEIVVKTSSSSSSESELDIEFTPPAGIIHPERFKRKKNVVHCDTQYNETDFAVKSQKSVENLSKETKNKSYKKKTKKVKIGKTKHK